MSLERCDIRARIDADVHTALLAICEVDAVTVAEFIEALLVPVVLARVSGAIQLHSKVKDLPLGATQRDIVGAHKR